MAQPLSHLFRYDPEIVFGVGSAVRIAEHVRSSPALFIIDAPLRGMGRAAPILAAHAAGAAGRAIGAQSVIGFGIPIELDDVRRLYEAAW